MGILDKIKKDLVKMVREEIEKYLADRGKSLDQVADDLDQVKLKIDEIHLVIVEGKNPAEVKILRAENDNSESK
jgi:hypothetical protein